MPPDSVNSQVQKPFPQFRIPASRQLAALWHFVVLLSAHQIRIADFQPDTQIPPPLQQGGKDFAQEAEASPGFSARPAHAAPRSPLSRSRGEVASFARRRDLGDVAAWPRFGRCWPRPTDQLVKHFGRRTIATRQATAFGRRRRAAMVTVLPTSPPLRPRRSPVSGSRVEVASRCQSGPASRRGRRSRMAAIRQVLARSHAAVRPHDRRHRAVSRLAAIGSLLLKRSPDSPKKPGF